MVNSMGKTIRPTYISRRNRVKTYYSKHASTNSSRSLKYFTRRKNRIRTRTMLKSIIVNPSIADTAIFNAYHKQEDVWEWF